MDHLTELAAAKGVATDFTDWTGTYRPVSPDTLRAVLTALGVDTSSDDAISRACDDVALAPWRRTLPATTVVRDDQPAELRVHVRAGEPVRVSVHTEQGTTVALPQIDNFEPDRDIDGTMIGEASFAIPAGLPLGYHEVRAVTPRPEGEHTTTAHLIVTPGRVRFPLGEQRAWGFATQLYQVRSTASWGIGDLADATDLGVWSAGHGADYLLLNPLHAAEPNVPMEPSPYLPTSRRFQNPIYLRPERIVEFAELEPAQIENIRAAHRLLEQSLADSDEIARDRVWPVKRAALRVIHDHGRSAGRQLAFETWVRRAGQGLRDFATWCALSDHFGTSVWSTWPAEYRSPTSEAVTAFVQEHHEDVLFHCWLQWCLDEQSARTQSAVRAAGMRLGLMQDLAVGVNPEGADAWALADVYASGVTVGAPPDQYSRLGQDWSQPPLRPDRLAETGYAAFRDMVRAVFRHSGGVRIDHIIGLFRLWWVPQGSSPTEGTYVRYDHDAMVGILCLEAQRAGAVVVGEDLGTVEPWVRDVLSDRGLFGTSILWFEKDWDADVPLPPERWRTECLASVTTHDLPPTAGYLEGEHVRLRHRLGLLDDLDAELASAERERQQWIDVLTDHALLDPQDADDTEAVIMALHRFLLKTPAKLLNVALTDAVGDQRAQNQPGTSDEYPNWRVPLTDATGTPLDLEDVLTSPRAERLAAVFESVGHGPRQ